MLGHFLASIYRTPRVDCHPSEDARCCSAPSLCWGYKLGSTKAGNFQGERKDIHMFSINADKWFSLGQISDSALSPLHFKPPSLGTMRSGNCALCYRWSPTLEKGRVPRSYQQDDQHPQEGRGRKERTNDLGALYVPGTSCTCLYLNLPMTRFGGNYLHYT